MGDAELDSKKNNSKQRNTKFDDFSKTRFAL